MNSNSGEAVSSLRQMQEQMSGWMAEKPQWDGGQDLRMLPGDLVLFQFMANGDEGDRLIKVYRSHIIAKKGNNGTPYNDHRYCPIQSQESNVSCTLCEQGHDEVKERMSMWLWIENILHTTMPKDKQFPVVTYEGRQYFNEEMITEGNPQKGAFKIWHTSAWRDSPWQDILKLGELYKGLHNFTAQLIRYGTGMQTRYKVIAIPNSAMVSPELYARAMQECTPIPEILHGQLASPVTVAPQQAQEQPISAIGTPSSAEIQPFVGPGVSAPSLVVPGLDSNQSQKVDTTQPESTSDNTIQIDPVNQEDERRPLKGLF